MDRWIVYGYYDDEPQVVIDIVDADDQSDAEFKVNYARGDDQGQGYYCDGAELLSEHIANMQAQAALPAEEVAKGLAQLEKDCRWDDEEDEDDGDSPTEEPR